MKLNDLLKLTIEKQASDLHLKVGVPPILRINGKLMPIETEKRTTQEEAVTTALGIMNPAQKARFTEKKELDMAYAVPGMGRFRVNVFQQRGSVGMVFRLVPGKILSFEDLMLPVVNAFYDDKNVLFEKYSFGEVKLNVGLTARDFSRYNDEYRF